jgi:integrative and conjugative element protein (TIGR02256 family)
MLKYCCIDLSLEISMEDALLSEMISLGKKYYPKEFGGLLLGRYEDGSRAIIERILIPRRFQSSRYSFYREVGQLRKQLQRSYDMSPRLLYLGEWHTHPDSPAVPSETDLRAMQTIAAHPEVHIKNPLLLILSIGTKTNESIYVFNDHKLNSYDRISSSKHTSTSYEQEI